MMAPSVARDSQVRALYHKELRLVADLEVALAENNVQPEALRNQFEAVARGYHSLLNQVIKLTLISDTLQQKLKMAEAERTATIDHVSRLNKNLRSLNDKKDEILALAAHDFRSPISGIQGLAQLLADGEVGDEGENRQAAKEIAGTAEEVLRMISNVLEVYRGGISSVPKPSSTHVSETTLANLLGRLESHLKGEARRKSIRFQMEIDTPEIVIGIEEDLFLRVAENLLSNALKFTPTGGSVITRAKIDENWLLFEVEDSGPGLSAKDQASLFKRFGTLSARPTGGEASIGLGLNIAGRILGHLGGSITCESEQGQGATFRVRLPIQRSKLQSKRPPVAA